MPLLLGLATALTLSGWLFTDALGFNKTVWTPCYVLYSAGLATFGLLFIPWALASAFFGRFVFIRRLEIIVFRLAVIFLILLFGRWGIVIIWELLSQ